MVTPILLLLIIVTILVAGSVWLWVENRSLRSRLEDQADSYYWEKEQKELLQIKWNREKERRLNKGNSPKTPSTRPPGW